MKTQNVNNKLAFNKAAVTELNNGQMLDVNGGSIGDIAGYIYEAELKLENGSQNKSKLIFEILKL